MKEFDDLIFSFMNLDMIQKKVVLSELISDNIKTISSKIGMDNPILQTDVLNKLKLSDNDDYLTSLYILVNQLEDAMIKFFESKNN